MQITIRVNADRVIRGTKKIAESIPDVGFRAIWKMMTQAKDIARAYPPTLPQQTYVRTGTYGRSFKVVKLGTGIIGARIESDAVQKGRHYTIYVGGNAMGMGQARVHQGRWQVIADVVDRVVVRNIAKEVEADMSTVIRQQGMGT